MKVLRTPDKCFKNIKDYPFNPVYTNIETKDGTILRIHHIDEGPKNGPILLAMHGQPVWSYLYTRMIPFLTKAGIRVVAPDLVGYGKSDKPAARADYSYQNQVDWMGEWLKKNNFENLTFFGQDWGGLIGLRMVAADPDRFIKIAMGNTGLPYNPNAPKEVIDEVNDFRASNKKISFSRMSKELSKMDRNKHMATKFMYWQKFTWDSENLPIGLINSWQMESQFRKSPVKAYIHILLQKIGLEKISPFYTDLMKAYEAPFPNPSYKMGPRAMPSQVPMIPDQSLDAQRKAREFFKTSEKPFLAVFAGNDPVTNGAERDVLRMAPNAKSAPHIGGGHFFQWTKAEPLSKILIDFIKRVIFMIHLYTASTPNGHKVSCLLEALEMPYEVHPVNLADGEQKKPEFLKISPNGRIPAIVDTENDNLSIFESGAIMLYLAEKAGKLIPSDLKGRAKVTEWLMFQMGGIGPMMGQANVFFRYFPEKIQPAIDRYQNESRRLFEVLDTHLADNEWLAGEYSIADIANWCWVRTHNWSGVSIDGLTHLEDWKNRMYEQPGMIKGTKVPVDRESIIKNKEDEKEFIKNAQKMVKK